MVKEEMKTIIEDKYKKSIEACSNEELYEALLDYTKEVITKKPEAKADGKKLYYISAEFLIGKLLSNNLINLGIYDQVQELLETCGKSLDAIEEIECEPSLGNGGLGRLAACFLDSIATLGLNGDGVGINYHLGLFRQSFVKRKQQENPNPWITEQNWLDKTEVSFEIPYADFSLKSVMYDIAVTGYNGRTNKLHLFDIETVDENIVENGITFDKKNIAKNLTLFLYPDDSDKDGELLRIYQQYFMVSNAAQLIIRECKEKKGDLHRLYEHAVIQINDTHPSLVIPELIRLLEQEGIGRDEAIEIVSRTCAYTNHTILAEALEKWPISYLEQVVPHLLPIIRELDRKVRAKYDQEAVYIIDRDERVHMAHMDIHYGFSVNGVAALHTEILRESELKSFFDIYPGKFNNKTNGITFRRWLMHCNPELTRYLTELIGDGYKERAEELEKLLEYKEDSDVLKKLAEIKLENKKKLKAYLQQEQGILIDENSVFDIQIKRLHEYKRQQMNALYIIYKYLEIKKGHKPARPLTVLFGAKAAPAYTIAKDIIHLLLCLQKLIESDQDVSPWLQVVVVENYNVTLASKLIPACDISEQIALASKEASGTGNMKFMLNGGVTLGTLDGANVEISDLVGEENIYIFGQSSEEVIAHYENGDYAPSDYCMPGSKIKTWVDFIVGDELLEIGCEENLRRLHKELVTKDWFMTLLDIEDYIKTKERMLKDYENTEEWSRKMLVNISKAGYFSADRTIKQYNEEIWHL